MKEEKINLMELEELKESYQIMNEKLESQEIISIDQIRAATEQKVEYLETELKTIFIWGYIISFPLLILLFYFTFGLSTGALITAGTYCLVNAAVSAFILRRVRRKDLVALDLNVLMEREKRYRKTFLIMLALTEVFWVAFAFTFMTTALGIIMLVILMLITVPRYYHSFVKAYKDGLQGKIEEQPSLLGRIGKIVGFTVLGILILALVAFAVLYIIAFFKTYQEIGFKDFAWVNYLYGLIALGFTVALITMLFETTGKNKGHRPSTFTIVLFSVSIFLYVASYLLDYFRNGVFDKSCLFMIAVSVVVISNFFKRKE
jgi:hypothetical protein